MRKALLIAAGVLLLVATLSTASFGDGPDPPPPCPTCDLFPH